MIYMDHAATSLGKPECVAEAVKQAVLTMGNPGRGSHEAALAAARCVYETRRKLAEFFGLRDVPGSPAAQRVVFVANATEGLNTVIKGLFVPGDHVITTEMEHNSVLRPLYELEGRGVELTVLPCDAWGCISLRELEEQVRDNTKAVVCTHASNVTGNVNDIAKIGRICRKYNLEFILDAAQTAGSIAIDMEKAGVSALVFTGHKGLLGPQGIGGICLAPGVTPRPLKSGGSGIHSFDRSHPGEFPEALEAGTLNVPGIAGLGAALSYLLTGERITEIERRERELGTAFYRNIIQIPGVRVLGDTRMYSARADVCGVDVCGADGYEAGGWQPVHAPILSINLAGIDAGEIADRLAVEYDIAVRAGAHCAPLMHQRLGTGGTGAVRFSFSGINTLQEAETAAQAVAELAASYRGRVTAYVGAGGKTGSIKADAAQLAGEGKKVLIMTTTKMAYADVEVYPCVWMQAREKESDGGHLQHAEAIQNAADAELIKKVKDTFHKTGICVVGMRLEGEKNAGKFSMPPQALFERLLYEADEVLIEADGSAHMPAKAPEVWEPVLPRCTDEVAVVMGMHAVGERVEDVCHRADKVMEVLACDASHRLRVLDLTRLMVEGYERPIRKSHPFVQFRKIYYQKDEG